MTTPATDRDRELHDHLRELLAATRRVATALDCTDPAHARLANQLDQLQEIADSSNPVDQLDQLADHVDQLRQLIELVDRREGDDA